MVSKNEKKHYEKLAQLGCIVCKQYDIETAAEIHHIKNHTGMGRKECYKRSIPLCMYHHRIGKEAYHHSPKSFTDKHGTQEYLLAKTLELLKGQG